MKTKRIKIITILTIIFLGTTNLYTTKAINKGEINMAEKINNINENVVVITPDSKKIDKVVVTNVDNTNIYNVFNKNGKVEVLTADTTKEAAPKEIEKLIAELKEGGVQKPVNARMFFFMFKWF